MPKFNTKMAGLKQSPKGFIEPGPSLKSLEATPAEQALLQGLIDWQEQSAKSHYILGGSVVCAFCHVGNNPNNQACWNCHRMITR